MCIYIYIPNHHSQLCVHLNMMMHTNMMMNTNKDEERQKNKDFFRDKKRTYSFPPTKGPSDHSGSMHLPQELRVRPAAGSQDGIKVRLYVSHLSNQLRHLRRRP